MNNGVRLGADNNLISTVDLCGHKVLGMSGSLWNYINTGNSAPADDFKKSSKKSDKKTPVKNEKKEKKEIDYKKLVKCLIIALSAIAGVCLIYKQKDSAFMQKIKKGFSNLFSNAKKTDIEGAKPLTKGAEIPSPADTSKGAPIIPPKSLDAPKGAPKGMNDAISSNTPVDSIPKYEPEIGPDGLVILPPDDEEVKTLVGEIVAAPKKRAGKAKKRQKKPIIDTIAISVDDSAPKAPQKEVKVKQTMSNQAPCLPLGDNKPRSIKSRPVIEASAINTPKVIQLEAQTQSAKVPLSTYKGDDRDDIISQYLKKRVKEDAKAVPVTPDRTSVKPLNQPQNNAAKKVLLLPPGDNKPRLDKRYQRIHDNIGRKPLIEDSSINTPKVIKLEAQTQSARALSDELLGAAGVTKEKLPLKTQETAIQEVVSLSNKTGKTGATDSKAAWQKSQRRTFAPGQQPSKLKPKKPESRIILADSQEELDGYIDRLAPLAPDEKAIFKTDDRIQFIDAKSRQPISDATYVIGEDGKLNATFKEAPNTPEAVQAAKIQKEKEEKQLLQQRLLGMEESQAKKARFERAYSQSSEEVASKIQAMREKISQMRQNGYNYFLKINQNDKPDALVLDLDAVNGLEEIGVPFNIKPKDMIDIFDLDRWIKPGDTFKIMYDPNPSYKVPMPPRDFRLKNLINIKKSPEGKLSWDYNGLN